MGQPLKAFNLIQSLIADLRQRRDKAFLNFLIGFLHFSCRVGSPLDDHILSFIGQQIIHTTDMITAIVFSLVKRNIGSFQQTFSTVIALTDTDTKA